MKNLHKRQKKICERRRSKGEKALFHKQSQIVKGLHPGVENAGTSPMLRQVPRSDSIGRNYVDVKF